ncbi:MAG TPA: hypothetical protein VFD89_01670 [Clostridia bacterium]|nr:hypothetical protein [Clostridia bacterium]
MEQFALIGMPDGGHRYIQSHPLLKFLPVKWAMAMIPRVKPRFTEIIYDKENRNELGYILDVPGFFIDKDKHGESNRTQNINNLVGLLLEKGIGVLVFPLWRNYISAEERSFIEESITILDGGLIKLVSLMDTVEKLFVILNAKPNEIEIGVWGADNAVGRIWTRLLAPRINYLVIGGEDKEALVELGSEVFHDTGLSCHISTDPSTCLSNKSMAILSALPKEWVDPGNTRLIILASRLADSSPYIGENNKDVISIESGWFDLPKAMELKKSLGVWERMGITEAMLFIRDSSYRNLFTKKALTLENLRIMKGIIEEHGIGFSNMISNESILSYNGFRRLYFGNFLDK